MATRIKLKRGTGSPAGSLEQYEVAMDQAAQTLYTSTDGLDAIILANKYDDADAVNAIETATLDLQNDLTVEGTVTLASTNVDATITPFYNFVGNPPPGAIFATGAQTKQSVAYASNGFFRHILTNLYTGSYTDGDYSVGSIDYHRYKDPTDGLAIKHQLNLVIFDPADGVTPDVLISGYTNKVETFKPFKLVNMDSTARDALSPESGWMIFNTTTSKLEVYDGSTWQAAW